MRNTIRTNQTKPAILMAQSVEADRLPVEPLIKRDHRFRKQKPPETEPAEHHERYPIAGLQS